MTPAGWAMIPASLFGPVINPINFVWIGMADERAGMVPFFGVGEGFSKDIGAHFVCRALSDYHITVLNLFVENTKVNFMGPV